MQTAVLLPTKHSSNDDSGQPYNSADMAEPWKNSCL